MVIQGGGSTATVVFKMKIFSLYFIVSGLPTGTTWSIALNGSVQNTTGGLIIFNETDGYYNYYASRLIGPFGSVQYVDFTPSGTIQVYGSSVTIYVKYVTQYYLALKADPSNGGTLSPGGWYNASTVVMISAVTNPNYIFLKWIGTGTGSYTGNSSSSSVTLESPIIEVAIFNETFRIIFNQTGLPSEVQWYLNITGMESYKIQGGAITLFMKNGTYQYVLSDSNSDYKPVQRNGQFTVSGYNVTIGVQFTIIEYSVTFEESGLPSWMKWNITFNGNSIYSDSNTIVLLRTNGTYSYIPEPLFYGVAGTRYYTGAPPGTVVLDGANWSLFINYSTQYYLTVEVTPINAGSIYPISGWYDSGVNITINATAARSYTFSYWAGLGDGSYSGYLVTSVIGMDSPITQVAHFVRVYVITFNETGLQAGTTWGVDTAQSNGSSIEIDEPNGTYQFPVSVFNSSYKPVDRMISFWVNGANKTLLVEFVKVTFSVTVKEYGLPQGTEWYLNFSGNFFMIHNYSINFLEPNGSYSYVVQTLINSGTGTRYTSSNSSGILLIEGMNVTVTIIYVTQYHLSVMAVPANGGTVYPVSGWYNDGSSAIINVSPISDYKFVKWVGAGNGSYSGDNPSDRIILNGPVNETAILARAYLVTVIENGLSPYTAWSISILGEGLYNSSTAMITLTLTNGTYSFIFHTVPGYASSPPKAEITINGSPLSISVNWSAITYPITITLYGISNGTEWSATLMGTAFNGVVINVTIESMQNYIIFNEPNGTYNYSVNLPGGYHRATSPLLSVPIKGPIHVSGEQSKIWFSVQPNTDYTLYAITAIIVIAALLAAIFFIRKTKRKH